MDSSVWNTTFSPGTTGQTPGKSPYYHDPQQQQHLQQLQQQQQQQQQHDSSTHHSTPSSLPFQANLPPHLQNPSTTPSSNFTDTEQMFLHQLEQNLYEAAAVHHHHHHHHHHHDPSNTQSNDTTPNSHIDNNPSTNTNNTTSTSSNSNSSNSNNTSNNNQSSTNIHQHRLLQSSGNVPPPPPPHQYEFGIENINFIIPEDLNFDTDPNHESSAFPPSNLPPTQTPSLLAINKSTPSSSSAGPTSNPNSVNNNNSSAASTSTNNDEKLFASPILPGQNEKSYNNQHYYHKQKLTEHHQAPQQHVRPDAVFTPLVSPAVTPLDSQVKSGVASNSTSASSYSQQPPVSIAFEPLTSPALNAQPSIIPNNHNRGAGTNDSNNDRRRSSSSVFGPVDETPATLTSTVYKRRTPHGTPILQGKPSSIKQSPSLKAKNGSYRNTSSSSTTNVNNFENLPESSLESSIANDMLPPSSKRNDLQSNNSGNSLNGNDTPLMGFTMGILAEHSQHEDEGSLLNNDDDDDDNDDDDDADDSNIDMDNTTNLPDIKPTVSRKSSTRSRKSSSSSFSNSNKLVSKSSSSTDTSPKLKASGGSSSSLNKKNSEKPATKKASHKLAEQGRRNRMNMAVHELGNLIPQAYHDEVTIPSKATTVELASKYIRALLNELDELKTKH